MNAHCLRLSLGSATPVPHSCNSPPIPSFSCPPTPPVTYALLQPTHLLADVIQTERCGPDGSSQLRGSSGWPAAGTITKVLRFPHPRPGARTKRMLLPTAAPPPSDVCSCKSNAAAFPDRHGVHRFHQSVKGRPQIRIMVVQRLATRTRLTESRVRFETAGQRLQFFHARRDGGTRQTCRLGNPTLHHPKPVHAAFTGGPVSARAASSIKGVKAMNLRRIPSTTAASIQLL